jgi:hypothetical protein
MNTTHKITVAFVTLAVGLVAYAASPTPVSSPRSSPSASSTPASKTSSSPASKTSPTPADLASPSEEPGRAVAAAATPAANNPPPKPVLYLISEEPYTAGGKNWIRKRYDVFNKSSYPAEMFAAAPGLPPCGANTNSSRTWVDFFDSTGKRLYGFCALSKPDDLGKIWVAFEEGVVPPSYVYIELNDRQTNTKYKSNLADTTM